MKFKKIAALFLSAVLLFSSNVYAYDSKHLTKSETAQIIIDSAVNYNTKLTADDIIKGKDNSDNEVTYLETLLLIDRVFGEFPSPKGHNKYISLEDQDFSDYPKWAEEELSDLYETGIINSIDYNSKVTADELQKILGRVHTYLGKSLKDDYYSTINKKGLDSLKIRQTANCSGTLADITLDVDKNLNSIITDLLKSKHKQGTKEQKITDFYRLAADMESRDKEGIKPLMPYLDLIKNSKNINDLIKTNIKINDDLCACPFFFFILSNNIYDSTKYSMFFECYSPTLQNEIYADNDSSPIKKAYKKYIKNILILGGNSEKDAETKMNLIYNFEEDLSLNRLSSEKYTGDVESVYKTYSTNNFYKIFKNIDMKNVYESFGYKPVNEIFFTDDEYVKYFASKLNNENIDTLKAVAEYSLLNDFGQLLSREFTDEIQDFNSLYYGAVGKLSYESLNLALTKKIMSDYLGQVYVEKYFSEESKKEIEEMTKTIINTYKSKIKRADWLSETTKKEALKKLDTLVLKVGYPDYKETVFDVIDIVPPDKGGKFFDTITDISQMLKLNNTLWQFEENDKSAWSISPQTVNACYDPLSNDITIPAALLQPPVYDPNASYEEKLGGIGTIIAHEISHAFDSTGAQFDENGNLKNWWTDNDNINFNRLCEKTVSFFDGKEAIPDVTVNGRLSIEENIADLGAMSCVSEIVSQLKDPDWRSFFTAYANLWLYTGTRDSYITNMQIDTHSPSNLRVNCILSNIDKFYEIYDIDEDDGMYVAPQNRIKIW